jgi:hypothetical protein
MSKGPGSGRMSNFRYAQPDCLESIAAVCATVEERPFQGRVSSVEDGLQPLWSTWARATTLAQPNQHSQSDSRHQHHPNQILM